MPLLCFHWYKFPRHVTSRLGRGYDQNVCGTIRTRKCRSPNWLYDNIRLNIMFREKYNLMQPRLSFKISKGVPEWNSNEWSKLLYFCCLSSKKKIWGLYFLKVPQRDKEWNSKRRKDAKGKNTKKYHSVKHIILKITYKKYVKNNYFSVWAEITCSLSQFRDTARLKLFKKSRS